MSSGDGSSFTRCALHHTAVTHKHIGIVIKDGKTGFVIKSRAVPLRHGHTYCHCKALAKGTGCGFDTNDVSVFWMPCSLAPELTEVLNIIDADIITKEMHQRIQKH